MAILDDFLIKSKNLFEKQRNLFFLISFAIYILLLHLLMLPAYLAELGWDTLHTITLIIWFLIGAIITVSTSGVALVVVGVIFLLAEWVQMNVFTLFLPDSFFEGLWGKLTFTWSLGTLLLPVLIFILYFAWEEERKVLEKEFEEKNQ